MKSTCRVLFIVIPLISYAVIVRYLIILLAEKGGKKLATKAVSKKPSFTAEDVMKGTKNWAKGNWVYFIAFLLPALLTFIAYVRFGIYPFASESSSQGENGSVLVLDLNGQYIYYFEALRDAFWGDGSFFYNWSRDLSGEFVGIIGYYLASPFTLIVMLLPRTMILESIMIMQLCKLGTAGVTFCLYVRKSKHLKPLQALLFSTAYAMMSYAVIQLIDPMWIDGIILLPLIVLGIEYFIDDGRKLNYIIPLALMFISNFYIGYMIAIFVAIYFFFYLFFAAENKMKAEVYVKKFVWFGISTIVVLMLSAIMILPVYNALSLGKFEFTEPDYGFATQFSPIELVPTLLPNQYYSVNMHGKPEIYCGVISLVLLPLFYMNKKIKFNKKLGYSFVLFLLFFSMYIRPVDMMWHGGQAPNWLPYRYSFLMSFILVSIAATVFEHIDGLKAPLAKISGSFAIILALVLWFYLNSDSFDYIQDKFKYVAAGPYTTTESYHGDQYEYFWFGTLAFGSILAAVYLIGIYIYCKTKNKTIKNTITIAMLCIMGFELSTNAYDTFLKIDKEVAYSKGDSYYSETQSGRDVTDALREYDSSFYRAEKTFNRTVNDNLAYRLRGITHSSSVMNAKIINFIETMGYKMQSFTTKYEGNTMLADSLLGIKYVIHDPDKYLSDTWLNPLYNEKLTYDYVNSGNEAAQFHIYENPNALSIGYMIDDSITNLAYLGNDNPFNSQNMFMSTITGNTQFETTPEGYINIVGNREYYKRIPETIELSECEQYAYGSDGYKYVGNAGASDPVINIHITAESSNYIYMFLKAPYKEPVNTWISTEKDENGSFVNHSSLGTGQYFEGTEYGILRIGSFEPGTDIEVRLTLTDQQNDGEYFTIIKDFFFYEFDQALFEQDIQQLKEHQWNISDNYTERHLEGTITAEEGQIMLLTIPSEPGWTVKVDGKKVETLEILKAFIGVKLTPGQHTVSVTYTPPGFVVGIFTLILGIAVCVLFGIYDKKNNKILLERARRKKLGVTEADEAPKPETAASKKDKIIKSKGAVSNLDITEADKAIEEAETKTAKQQAEQSNQKTKNSNKKKNGKKKK